jgi:wyosine [tRNA(Phe)-imidazoG37] synthetase (radical SAM superfamily)
MKRIPAKYVFGPVPSRRLGRSLGIDVVPFKTCSFDCIYCQLGRTTRKTVDLAEYVPVDGLQREIGSLLDSGIDADYITFSGSGEPTLHSKLGTIIDHIKNKTDIPVAVLTNGSLLWRPEARDGLSGADLVIPSLDAGDDRLFRYVNRPHPSLHFRRVVDGIQRFREEFKKTIWLEVFVLGGVTTVTAELAKIRACIAEIRPDRVQLNTVARPPSECYAHAVPPAQLRVYARFLGRRTEIITGEPRWADADRSPRRDEIIGLLKRRPCTADQIAQGIGAHRAEVVKRLQTMLQAGEVCHKRVNNRAFYAATERQQ